MFALYICIATAIVLVYHVNLVLKKGGRTSLEDREKQDAKGKRACSISMLKYDRGRYNNFRQVFGADFRFWALPLTPNPWPPPIISQQPFKVSESQTVGASGEEKAAESIHKPKYAVETSLDSSLSLHQGSNNFFSAVAGGVMRRGKFNGAKTLCDLQSSADGTYFSYSDCVRQAEAEEAKL